METSDVGKTDSNDLTIKQKIIHLVPLSKVQDICLELMTTFHEICTKNDIIYWIDFGTLLGAYRHKGFIPWDNDIDICMPMEEYKRVIPLLKEHCNKKDNDHILFFGDTKVDYWYDYFGNAKFLANGIMPVKIDIFPAKIIENTPEAIATDKSLTNIASAYILGKAMHPDDILQEHIHYIPDNNDNIIIKRHEFFEDYENYMLNNKIKDCVGKNYLLTYSDNDFLVKRERDYFLLDDIFPINKIEFEKKMFNAPANIEEHLENLYGDFMKLPPEEQRTSSYAIVRENKKIPKKKIKNLIFMIYYHSAKIKKFDNLEKNNTNKTEKIKFFIKISLHLFLKFRIRSLRRFITYFILYHLPVTNKAHLDI